MISVHVKNCNMQNIISKMNFIYMKWIELFFHLSRLIARFAFWDGYDNFQNESKTNHELDFFGTSRYKYFQCLC